VKPAPGKPPRDATRERTRERIVAAALEIIGREGVQGFTVRRVTEAADVNLALVNYHFRSKQALVDETLAHYFQGITKVFEILDGVDAPPEAKLRRFIEEYLKNLFAYPGAFTSQILIMVEQSTLGGHGGGGRRAPSRAFLAMLKEGTSRLKACLGELLGTDDESIVGLRAVQLLTNIAHPMFLTGFPKTLFHLDFHNAAIREKYIDMAMEAATGRR